MATGAALITVDAKGENCIAAAPGANLELSPGRVEELRDLISSSSVLLLQYELRTETTVRALEIAREAGVEVLFNFAPPHDFPVEALSGVSTLIVNETEAAFVSGKPVNSAESGLDAAREIVKLGVKRVLVTLGAQGVLVVEADAHTHVPAFPVTAVDTTAAGDTFCGCLAVALAEGKAIRDAVRFACAGAALSVQRPGAQPSIPVRSEINALFDKVGSDA